MKIKEITDQHRRDFRAIYVCENCGHEEEGRGYDDANFHENAIPQMVCENCGKSAGAEYEPRETKYPEGRQV